MLVRVAIEWLRVVLKFMKNFGEDNHSANKKDMNNSKLSNI